MIKSKISLNFWIIVSIIFITLKIMNYINWSWWLVLSPIWCIPLFAILVLIIGFIFSLVFEKIDKQ